MQQCRLSWTLFPDTHQGPVNSSNSSQTWVCAAYEAGRREPRILTAQDLLNAVGASLQIITPPSWSWTQTRRPYAIPSHLWALASGTALSQFQAPAHLWWSGPPRTFDLSQRKDRLHAYEVVLREGTPQDISAIVDAMLLCEAWADLVLPADLSDAWQPLIDHAHQTVATKASAA